jgi:hypothetical protein
MNTQDLQHDLVKKAIAWVLADRICDEHMATVDRIQREIDAHLRDRQAASEHDRDLLQKLEYEKIGFTLACQSESKCGEEMRAAAQVLVKELEKLPADPAIHVLSNGYALCAFSLETPSQWPTDHRWISLASLREGINKIEDLSCAACADSARVLLAGAHVSEKKLP